MKRIDNIREELEKGYKLTISRVGKKCNGLLALQPHEYLISACETVDVDCVMNVMPSIMEVLGSFHTICQISYDRENRKILSQIKKMKTEGPYCEISSYEVVEDLETRTDDIFMGLIELDEKISEKSKGNESNKGKIKVKNGE